MKSSNNNSTIWAITGIIGLLIVAGVIAFIVWQKNKSLNSTDLAILNAINTQQEFGTNIYDVMLGGQRNDSTAGGSSSGLGISSLF